MSELTYWFRCPGCGVLGVIDADQAEGRVSIECVTPACMFHATGRVEPLVASTEPVNRDRFTTRLT